MNRKYQICTNCVMDTTDSHIVFDENGMCDHCHTYYDKIKPNWHPNEQGEKELEQIVDKIKYAGRNKDFDCILGMSGGIDSSYLLYLAKEKLGLRPLVFHVDAGWNTQIAVNNIQRLVDGLGLDLYTEVIDWEEMKDVQRAFFHSGVSQVDAPQDYCFFATMYKFASKYNIKYILTGGNYSTECVRNPLEWMYYQSDTRQLHDIHKTFGVITLKNFPSTNILWHKFWLPYVKGIKLIRPLDYLPYNKQEAMTLLTEKYGYQPYPQKHFESRFTRFYESYWLPKRFGYDTRKVQFSSLILTGQMTREEALFELAKPDYNKDNIQHEFEYVANKLDMTVEELQKCMELPFKTYKDYKNESWVYNIGATLMRFFGKERGGKR